VKILVAKKTKISNNQTQACNPDETNPLHLPQKLRMNSGSMPNRTTAFAGVS
jgi:hypothetical protein